MDDFALVINAGSSSLKFAVCRRTGDDAAWSFAARGQIEGIGTPHPGMSAKDARGTAMSAPSLDAAGVKDSHAALDLLGAWLRGVFGQARVLGIGHRVVHGGPNQAAPARVTSTLLDELRKLVPLAPLHQPYNLAAIDAFVERMPDVPQVACFDTAFHRGQPDVAQLVPLPADIRARGVQRYGFHGLSYEYIASTLPTVAPDIASKRVVVAHLGSGASLCAMRNGRSVDSTLGFTALDGLCMGTRPGALDPGVVLYLFQELKLTPKQVEELLYKKSGLLGISGIGNDMRDLLASDAPAARLAIEYFVYRAAKELGAMTAALGGLDGLVFTAGIGENAPDIRRRICAASSWLGIALDDATNKAPRGPTRISRDDSRVPVWVVPTNEELMIALHTGRLLGLAAIPA
jgi:acetate kinase